MMSLSAIRVVQEARERAALFIGEREAWTFDEGGLEGVVFYPDPFHWIGDGPPTWVAGVSAQDRSPVGTWNDERRELAEEILEALLAGLGDAARRVETTGTAIVAAAETTDLEQMLLRDLVLQQRIEAHA